MTHRQKLEENNGKLHTKPHWKLSKEVSFGADAELGQATRLFFLKK